MPLTRYLTQPGPKMLTRQTVLSLSWKINYESFGFLTLTYCTQLHLIHCTFSSLQYVSDIMSDLMSDLNHETTVSHLALQTVDSTSTADAAPDYDYEVLVNLVKNIT